MTRRFVSVAVAVMGLLLAANARSQAQGWAPGSDGVASVQGAYASGEFVPAGPSYGPATPAYHDGPARHWNDNISGDKGGLYENSPLDEFIGDMVKDSYFRLEYLNWSFKDPGDILLGSETNASLTPSERFDITLNQVFAGEARVATTSALKLRHNNGVRGTLGIPLLYGTIEGNIFSFDSGFDHQVITGLGAPLPGNAIGIPQFIGTTTLTSGQIGTNIFLYDNAFAMTMKTNYWGTEANYLFDSYDPQSSVQFRPLFGFRFISSDEDFNQTGVFDQQGQLPIPIVSLIDSRSRNDVYSPQIGFRLEYVHRWLTLGLEPKLGLGWNNYSSAVNVQRLRALGDDTVFTEDSGSKISATGEFGMNAKLHLHKNFSVTVGYQIIFADNVSRPHNSIYYNDNGPPPAIPADVRVNPSFEVMYYQGINVGGELRF